MANGYAINSTIATVGPDMGELRLELPPARPVRLRLLSEKDEPVAGAEISVPEYRNRGHLLTWKGTTDADGWVIWTNALHQALSLQITPTNYPMRMARLEPVATEQIVRLRKEAKSSIAVHIRVLEEGSQKPVAKFAVWRDLEPTESSPFAHLNPMPFEAAAQMEKDLAEDLRRDGYTVTGGH